MYYTLVINKYCHLKGVDKTIFETTELFTSYIQVKYSHVLEHHHVCNARHSICLKFSAIKVLNARALVYYVVLMCRQ